ncbi:MAG: GHKL domain-containing protein [Firmicutes bacterium]|nr:GHKL domain-containing protein [Bacillota bacterium]MBQ9603890.1 GHKL domain-containing protein [Bacillota bacterium]
MTAELIWNILEFTVCLADALLLFGLAKNHFNNELTLKKLLFICIAAILSSLRVRFVDIRLIAPLIGIFISCCLCRSFGIAWYKALTLSLLFFVFIEMSELFVMGIFTLVLRENYGIYSQTPLFNLAGIVLSRLIFLAALGLNALKLRYDAPARYRFLLITGLLLVTLCTETLCVHTPAADMSERLVFAVVSVIMFAVVLLIIIMYNTLTLYYVGYYENQSVAGVLKANEELYSSIIAGDEQLRRTVHDCKNHLFTASELLEQNKTDEALQYLKSVAGGLERPYKTYLQNNIADIVISRKAEAAEKKGIDFTVSGVLGNVGIDRADISSLLSNLLDNATEAAEKCENGFVRLKAKIQGEYVYISAANSISAPLKLRDGELVTTKPDPREHGMGIKIIKNIVARYDGEFDFNAENATMTVYVLLKPKELTE